MNKSIVIQDKTLRIQSKLFYIHLHLKWKDATYWLYPYQILFFILVTGHKTGCIEKTPNSYKELLSLNHNSHQNVIVILNGLRLFRLDVFS